MHVSDPIVGLRLIQVAGFAALAIFMFTEPMNCGGENRIFHRLLAGLFAVESWEALALTSTHAQLLTMYDGLPITASLLLSEIAVAALIASVLVHLVYQSYRLMVFNSIREQDYSDRCTREFKP